VRRVESTLGRRAASLALALSAFMALPASDDAWPQVPLDLELVYPRDHGAHPDFRTEWWYVTGQGATASGRVFGVQFTIFRAALAPPGSVDEAEGARSRQAFAGHFAITDVASGEVRFAERLRRGGTPLAHASTTDMDVRLDGWRISRDAGTGHLIVTASDAVAGIGVDLELVPTKPLVLHGEDGYSSKGGEAGNASAYASFTRLALDGEVRVDDASFALDGLAWFDQEFGSSVLGAGVVGWDWFGLHLDDGRDLMAFVLRREDGTLDPASAATLVDEDGAPRALTAEEFTLTSRGAWTSPVTGATYPNRWSLAIESAGLQLELAPRVADCELVTENSTGVSYWEGPVLIEGTSNGAPVGGSGYGELTGYAGSMGGRL